MSQQEIYEKVEKLVREYCDNADDKEDLRGVNLLEDLDYDSIGLMHLIIAIEQEFEIDTDSDVMIDNFDTFDGIVEYVTEKVQQKQG